ncbi:MAG TPA: GNAT family N-acetyltransferase [Acidimicrobiales bacterium]|jgi:ribosomal protein S18 acetylase RimI-like enzyme
MKVEIEAAAKATNDLVESLNRLLPQLSSSAEPLTLNDVEWMVNSDVVTLYVARHEGRVVGTLTLAIFAIPTGWRAWIEDVVVDETARGLGVGEQMTMAAVDDARRRGVRSVDLTSRPTREAANALYQKLGFEYRETNVYRFSIENS